LRYRYPASAREALAGVDLELARGEFAVLAGSSASGKSTLLRAACGLVPHFHGGSIEGELVVAGMDVRTHGPAELAAAVALVAQEPETQVVSTTVRAEIELPLELRGAAPDERARAVEEVALALGMPHLLGRTTDALSGGELQRVALAAALATRPTLLLLDEPTSQLDPVAGEELIGLLRRLNEEWGVAVLLCEHRLERCLPAADRVVAIEDGVIAFDGAPEPFLGWALDEDPALATPAAQLFRHAGLPPPRGVREARRVLAARGGPVLDAPPVPAPPIPPGDPAVRAAGLWVELGADGERTEALRGVELGVTRGERVAVMGRNGAGKTTLLRAVAGMVEPSGGIIEAPAGAALLPQRPEDMLVCERVGDELPGEAGRAAMRLVGLDGCEDRDPRDLSGGERQRLALATVIAGRGGGSGQPPGAVLLDEPTRGLDRQRKRELAALAARLATAGAAMVIATHDVEFAATFAQRVVLLGEGEVIADGPAEELLAGGWYFSTEVARVLDGAATTAERGGELLAAALGAASSSPTSAAGRGGSR
jgi:energy-coupling factor transport system ATP-binding protein